ncbi:hypothetical protein ACH5RR_001424 [Cinchona calisaya]|uniref:Peptidase A1 domain-containing protein n=1 Tax=Cinchona calisaya TaxID=153742 RepID=A0ABD3B3G1_9GENT
MASKSRSTSQIFIIFLTLFSLISISKSHAIRAFFKTNALVFPVRKDPSTSLHVAYILKRTPLVKKPFLVDLNGKYLWVNCEKNYSSSTYTAPSCHSTHCSRAGIHYCHKCSFNITRPGCHNNSCFVLTKNPLTRRNAIAELAQDVLSIQSTQGSKSGPPVRVPNFLFACAPSSLLKRPIPKTVQGVAGFGHSPLALPLQLASHFGFSPVFALCLSPSIKKYGVIFIGNGPYVIRPGLIDISRPIVYTPLTIGSQGEYFILVRLIKINNKPLRLKSASFSESKTFLRTTISTTTQYTSFEHSLFKIFTKFFLKQLSGRVVLVKPVTPFEVCFNSNFSTSNKTGPEVPKIDFVLQNRNSWICGANSIVRAQPNLYCLAFVNGGSNAKASILIGTHQLENNLLQFDLARSRLGFTSSLLLRETSCGNFDFSSNSRH